MMTAPFDRNGIDGSGTASAFRQSLAEANRQDAPFTHWLLHDALPSAATDAILALPFDPPPGLDLSTGRREANNDERVYFDPANQARFPVCRETADALQAPETIDALNRLCGIDLTGTNLRIEYTMDRDGFWLEPHTDIKVKKFTMLIYLSKEDWARDLGTDLYDGAGNHVGAAPFIHNHGLIFIPGDDTWHGLERRPIPGIRRSLIVNYVTPDWRAREELCFPDRTVTA